MEKKPVKKKNVPIPVQRSETDVKANWYKKQGINVQNRRQRNMVSDFYKQLDRAGRGL